MGFTSKDGICEQLLRRKDTYYFHHNKNASHVLVNAIDLYVWVAKLHFSAGVNTRIIESIVGLRIVKSDTVKVGCSLIFGSMTEVNDYIKSTYED